MIHNPLIFVHNPKTAGTTFISVAQKNYRPSEVFTVSGLNINKCISEFKNLEQSKRDSFKLILGHETIGLHKYLTNKVQYVTYLRDPVDHFVSFYYYVKRATAHGYHHRVKEMKSIHEFFDFVLEKGWDNLQTRNLADPQGNKHESIEELFQIGKKHLMELIDFVFISEGFDQSLVFFQKKLGWKNVVALNANVTIDRPSVESLDSNVVDVIKEINRFDLKLYEFAKEKHAAILVSMNISQLDIDRLRRKRNLLSCIEKIKQPVKDAYHFLRGDV